MLGICSVLQSSTVTRLDQELAECLLSASDVLREFGSRIAGRAAEAGMSDKRQFGRVGGPAGSLEFKTGSFLAGEKKHHRRLRQLITMVIDGR